MIASIHGKITFKNDKFAIVETVGVGYKIFATLETLNSIKTGQDLFFFTYMNIREDAMDLYGFLDRHEQEFFEMLLSVPSIGPKSALNVLSVAGIPALTQAIGSGDTSYLTKISGIGRKTAEKIVIELRDKIGTGEEKSMREDLDAMEALLTLGYSQAEARDALKNVKALDTNTKIKEALKILGGN